MKVYHNFLIFIIFIIKHQTIVATITCEKAANSPEESLKHALLCSSIDPLERPINDEKNSTLFVAMRLHIKSFNYDETYSIITVNSWLSMSWMNKNFKWKPEEYGGIDTLVLHSTDIWMPDLSIYNSETTQFRDSCSDAHCVINNDGAVSCIPPCSHSAACKSNYVNWPFDVQNCTLHYGAWMHKGEEITFRDKNTVIDRSGIEHNEWKLLGIKVKNNPGNYSCCPNETYPTVTYSLLIQRISATEEIVIVAPALILVFLNLCGLWLSPNGVERVYITLISLLAHILYLQEMAWLLPKNGSLAPKALVFFRDSMVVSAILIFNTIIMRALLRCQAKTPDWIKSTANSIRGNKIGQLMFTNPYLIDEKLSTTNSSPTINDGANLIESQPDNEETTTPESFENENKTKTWFTFVKFLDSIIFIILLLFYIIMIIHWLPSGNTQIKDPTPMEDIIYEDDE